ncbi:MAG TPA: exonuclease domain-containing protein, partial [Burkholderiales bacterium]
MAQDPNNLIWIDMEMSGLNPDNDRVLEVAIVITDAQLNVVAEGPVKVVHQADEVFERMDSWNKSTHKKS